MKLGRGLIATMAALVLGLLIASAKSAFDADSIPMPFLVVLVFWITVIFGSFGLFAPPNGTVVAVLLVCALSIAASIFLIVEMGQPFEGLLKISSAPLHYALSHLGE